MTDLQAKNGDETRENSAPPPFVLDAEDVENELVHIDDQLITIEDSLDVITDEFLHLDEQLAVRLSDEEEEAVAAAAVSASASASAAAPEIDEEDLLFLDPVDYEASPFDDWVVDSDRELQELAQVLASETDAHLSSVSRRLNFF